MSNLASVCNLITRGKAPDYETNGPAYVVKSAQVYPTGIDWSGCPQVSARYVGQVESQFRLRSGDVLLNGTGTGTLGRPAIAWTVPEGLYLPDSHVNLIRPDQSKIDPGYLFFWLLTSTSQTFIEQAAVGSTNQIELAASRVAELPLPHPLPSLAEQRRIAGMLRAADDERRRRRYTQTLSDGLLGEVFVRMFGDLNTHIQFTPLEAVAEIVSGVTKGQKYNGRRTVEVPYLRVANVQAGYLDLSEIKTIEALPEQIEELTLQRGDILMTEGGDFDKLGRGAIWQAEIPLCIHQNHIFRVRLNQERVSPVFFAQYLNTKLAKDYFLWCAKQTTNLASINMSQLKALPVPILPADVERQFSVIVILHEQTRRQQQESARQSDHLFDTLLHRAFAGEV